MIGSTDSERTGSKGRRYRRGGNMVQPIPKASSTRSMRRKQEQKQLQRRKRRHKHILHQCSSPPSSTSIALSSLLPFNPTTLLATSLLATLLFLAQMQPTEAFAAWLAEGPKCYTDLAPGEIIMNAPVIPYSESQYPDIGIQVYDEDGRLVQPVAVGSAGEEEGGGSTASTTVGGTAGGMKWSGQLNTKKGQATTTAATAATIIEQSNPRSIYTLHLSISSKYLPPLGTLGDVQYTIDLSLSSPAEFVGSNTGCDFRRAYGRAYGRAHGEANGEAYGEGNKGSDGVKLRIDFDGEAADEVDAGEVVKVWAGWATGHEAVTLTREVVFVRKKDGDEGGEDEGEGGGDKEKRRGEHSGEAGGKLDEAAIRKIEDAMDRADKAAAAASDAAVEADAADTPSDKTPSDKTPHAVETAQGANRWAAADYEGGGASKSKMSEEEEEKQKKEVARNKLKEMRRNVHHPDGGHDADAVVRDQIGVKNKKNENENKRKNKNKNDGDTDDDEEGEYENKQRRRRRDFDLDRDQQDIESRKRREHRTEPDVAAAQTHEDGVASSSKKHQSFRHRYRHTDLGMQNFSMRGYFVGCGMMAAMALGLARYSAIVGRRLHKGTRRL